MISLRRNRTPQAWQSVSPFSRVSAGLYGRQIREPHGGSERWPQGPSCGTGRWCGTEAPVRSLLGSVMAFSVLQASWAGGVAGLLGDEMVIRERGARSRIRARAADLRPSRIGRTGLPDARRGWLSRFGVPQRPLGCPAALAGGRSWQPHRARPGWLRQGGGSPPRRSARSTCHLVGREHPGGPKTVADEPGRLHLCGPVLLGRVPDEGAILGRR